MLGATRMTYTTNGPKLHDAFGVECLLGMDALLFKNR